MHSSAKSEVITILGGGRVGKTSIIRRFLQQTFVEKYTPTVEDTFSKIIEINNQPVNVQFVDSSGSYSFPAMRRLWIQKATAFILVISVTDDTSFELLPSLLSEIRQERKSDNQLSTPIVIAVNKTDEKSELKQIDDEIIEDWVLNNEIPFDSLIYCSAKTNDSVTNLFQALWEQRRDQIRNSQILQDIQSTTMKYESSTPAPIIHNQKINNLTQKSTKTRRFSAFAILTGSNNSTINSQNTINSRRESAALVDTLGNLNGCFNNNTNNSPAMYHKGRRGSRASITKLLVGVGGGSQKGQLKQAENNLKFDCIIS